MKPSSHIQIFHDIKDKILVFADWIDTFFYKKREKGKFTWEGIGKINNLCAPIEPADGFMHSGRVPRPQSLTDPPHAFSINIYLSSSNNTKKIIIPSLKKIILTLYYLVSWKKIYLLFDGSLELIIDLGLVFFLFILFF